MSTVGKEDRLDSGVRRKRRSPDEIRDRVLAAAGEAFTRFGYSGATTAEIARSAEVTEAQIFRYFASKAELFEAAVFEPLNRGFAEFNAAMLKGEPPTGSLRQGAPTYIAALQDFMEQHSKALMTLVVARAYEKASGQERAIGDDLSEYFAIGAATMRERLSAPARVPPELMVRVSFAAVLGCALFRDWMFPPGLATDEDIRRATIDFVLDGINANSQET